MRWTLLEKLLSQLLGFGQGVILARLLSPHDFGLAAMLGLFLAVATTLADSGLGSAYVVLGASPRAARRILLWNVALASFLYLLLALASPFIAAFYAEPILRPLVLVMGLTMIFSSCSVLGAARLQRARRFAALSLVNTLTTLGGFLTALTLALLGFGVWTLAWTGVAASLLRLILLSCLPSAACREERSERVRYPPSEASPEGKPIWGAKGYVGIPTRDPEEELAPTSPTPTPTFHSLLSYGLKTTLSALIHTLYLNSYQLILGKLANPSVVGLFSRAQRWAALPVDIVNDSVSRVSLPNLVSGVVSGRRYILLNAALLWPCLAILHLFAPELIGFVFGPAWLASVPYLRILILGVALTPFGNISLNYLRSRGRADLVLVTDAIKKPLQITALVSGVLFGTVEALCWAKVASDFFEAAVDFAVAWWLRWSSEYMWTHLVTLSGTKTGDALAASHARGDFARLLSGKSIAVVGNGPSELGKGLGPEIDAHDLVIRINNYKTKGYEADYGARADIWMKGGAADVVHKLRPGLKAILYTDDPFAFGLLRRFAKYPARELKRGLIVDYIERTSYLALESSLGARPSSGAVLIDYLRSSSAARVDVYGFAFLESRPAANEDGFIHYTHDIDPLAAKRIMLEAHHSAVKESSDLAALFTGRTLRLRG